MKVIYDQPPLPKPTVSIGEVELGPMPARSIEPPPVTKAPNWWTHDDRWWNAKDGDLFTIPWYARYPLGALATYGSWWTFVEWDTRKFLARWIIGGCLVMISLGLMRELLLGVILAALAGLALWAAGAAVAALPVSVAIVVGALIIAAAVKRK